MHGRVKTRTTEEQKEIARKEKCKKAKAYQETMRLILEKRSASSCDKEALDLTASLLIGNPDIITLWNYRREIFLNLKEEESVEEYQKLLEKDVNLTEQCLRVNPKSYGSWHHRIWILDNLPEPDWEKELKLCTKYLQLDERNFHCWDYRRIVTQRSNIPDEDEYKYTLEKIESNFSNYSAWHLRSKLLPRIFPDPGKRFPINEDKHKEELELVENAAFTDPNDQSAWFYLRWLLGLTEPKVSFVCVEASTSDIFVVTSRKVKLCDDTKMGVKMKVMVNNKPAVGKWESACKSLSCLWTFQFEAKINPNDCVQLTLEENGVKYNSFSLQANTKIQNKPNFHPTFSDSLRDTLTNQLSSCKLLIELEPDSKWTLLTSIFLMLSIDSHKYESEIISTLDKLSMVDPLRSGYYLDLRSKIFIQLALSHSSGGKTFVLSQKNLTELYHSQYLTNFEEVNLRNNNLSSQSCSQLYALVNCRVLNLANNKIKNLNSFPGLPKLEILLLDNNQIEEVEEKWVESFPKLTTLSLIDNPVTRKENRVNHLCQRLSGVLLSSGPQG